MQTRRKILFLITKATWGGAQKYVYDLATNLPKEQYEVLVAYGAAGRLAADLIVANVRTFEIPSLGRDIAFFSDLKSFFEIRRLIRSERPDVVHLNSSKAAGLGSLAARLAGAPKIIFTVHGVPHNEPRNFVWRAFAYFGTWLSALLSDRVICVSEYDLRTVRTMPLVGRKPLCIYNGIDLSLHFGAGHRIRDAFPPGVFITGTIGELTHNKNQIALVKEAQRDPNMYVAIVGEGEDRDMLERAIQEAGLGTRVKLFGFLGSQEALRGFDRFALPSLKEGLPYVLLEAKLAGLPISANRVGGVPEVLDHDISEFSLKRMVEQTEALYRAIP